MISQIRPSIHHLGDQIIWVSSEIEKGRKHFDIELTAGVYDLFPDITWEPIFTRYDSAFELDYLCRVPKFDESKFEPCEIPTNPYITVQFDTSKDHEPDSPEKRIYSLDEDWKNWILNKYISLGFEVVDVGGKKWSLAQTAYIMKHSQGHVGAVSAFSIFSRGVGSKFTHQYYNAHMRETTEKIPDVQINFDSFVIYMGYISFYSNNGIKSYFRDPNLVI